MVIKDMNVVALDERDFDVEIRAGRYDFIEFGCSNGGSLQLGLKKFGGTNAVGIDIDANKVAVTRSKGYDAFLVDATALSAFSKSVRFVTMIDFLEHLPGFDLAKQCIQ